jgi:hypothetical protein
METFVAAVVFVLNDPNVKREMSVPPLPSAPNPTATFEL